MSRDSSIVAVVLVAVCAVLLAVVMKTNGAGGGDAREALALAESGADHIGVAEAATLIMTKPESIKLIDLRPAADFAVRSLPGAINMTLPEVLGDKGRAVLDSGAEKVILFSNGPAHPSQAWVALHALGRRNVCVLDGGLEEFDARLLTPPSMIEGADPAAAKKDAPVFAIRRAFFLENARASVAATDPESADAPALVSVDWAAKRKSGLRFVDARESAAEFSAFHVRDAVSCPPASLRTKAFNRDLFLKPVQDLARRFGELGLSAEDAIVVYADDRLHDASLVALALLKTGATKVFVLDGGIRAWAAAHLALASGDVQPKAVTFTAAAPANDFEIRIDDLAAAIGAKKTAVLDVRAADQFEGKTSTEARAGHIPGAKNRPIAEDVIATPAGTFFRAKADVENGLAALGIGRSEPVAVSCRTGHQASASYFFLKHVLGKNDVRWFNGSWTEWASRADLPAAVGR